MPAKIYTENVSDNYFLLKKYLHWHIRRDGCRKSFVRCSTNVLRANTGGEKQKPASENSYIGMKLSLVCVEVCRGMSRYVEVGRGRSS